MVSIAVQYELWEEEEQAHTASPTEDVSSGHDVITQRHGAAVQIQELMLVRWGDGEVVRALALTLHSGPSINALSSLSS